MADNLTVVPLFLALTVTRQDADFPLLVVAVISAIPCLCAVILPFETDTTLEFELFQITFCEADAGLIFADKLRVSPTCSVFELYDNLILLTSSL